jgi:serine/threonine protein kinase
VLIQAGSPGMVKESGTFDIRSDIYSLGAVLFEMTTRRKPFHSENPYTLMLAHVEQKPPPPSEVNPELPPALDEILLKALEKNPEDRFQSAACRAVLAHRLTLPDPPVRVLQQIPVDAEFSRNVKSPDQNGNGSGEFA